MVLIKKFKKKACTEAEETQRTFAIDSAQNHGINLFSRLMFVSATSPTFIFIRTV